MKNFRVRRVKVDPSKVRIILKQLHEAFLTDGGEKGIDFDRYLERLVDMKILVEDESEVWKLNQGRRKSFEGLGGDFMGMMWEQDFVVVILVKKAEILL